MGSKSETGHAVNAANFTRMIAYAENAGAKYNPPNDAISVVNLKIKDQKQIAAIKLFHEKAAIWMQDVNAREAAMEPVNKLMTRVKNLVNACNVLPQFINDVSGLVKKIQGVRATPKIKTEVGDVKSPTEETIIQISASQQGIDNKIDNLDKLLELLKAEPNYLPNEADLRITAIETLINDAKAKNKAVGLSAPPLESARNDRNNELYGKIHGGLDLANVVKSYFKAIFGGNSVEYHNIAKLEFKRLVK